MVFVVFGIWFAGIAAGIWFVPDSWAAHESWNWIVAGWGVLGFVFSAMTKPSNAQDPTVNVGEHADAYRDSDDPFMDPMHVNMAGVSMHGAVQDDD
jgi:hypothetical protein